MTIRSVKRRERALEKQLNELEYQLEISRFRTATTAEQLEPQAVEDYTDQGGYLIRNAWTGSVVAGHWFDLSLYDVENFIKQKEVERERMYYGG